MQSESNLDATRAIPTVLVLGTDLHFPRQLTSSFAAAGLEPIEARSVVECRGHALRFNPTVILLAGSAADPCCLGFLSSVRSDSALRELPVAIVCHRCPQPLRLAALERGADLCLADTTSDREMTAWVNALLRAPSLTQSNAEKIVRGRLSLDPINYITMFDQRVLKIGRAEFKLLLFFVEHPNKPFSREQLLKSVWGQQVAIDERTVDVSIMRLRKAFTGVPNGLRTIRGIGYQFEPEELQA
ncbi:response regulator transcription factor [Massilia putida]|jgi:two-component system phosphate regulon response regulator PhoB|uniref:response regulator transcription factor n=1 Tax=Massilia putida TaxID=1141883 RepID=UPI001474D931|nr:response regulator transcription factor [Massilia putida]